MDGPPIGQLVLDPRYFDRRLGLFRREAGVGSGGSTCRPPSRMGPRFVGALPGCAFSSRSSSPARRSARSRLGRPLSPRQGRAGRAQDRISRSAAIAKPPNETGPQAGSLARWPRRVRSPLRGPRRASMARPTGREPRGAKFARLANFHRRRPHPIGRQAGDALSLLSLPGREPDLVERLDINLFLGKHFRSPATALRHARQSLAEMPPSHQVRATSSRRASVAAPPVRDGPAGEGFASLSEAFASRKSLAMVVSDAIP